MPTPIADMVEEMLALGAGHSLIVLAVRTAEMSRDVWRDVSRDDLDSRRAADRVRQQKRRDKIREIAPKPLSVAGTINPVTVTKTSRDEGVTKPLILTSSLEFKLHSEEESKRKPRARKKQLGPVPEGWRPPQRASELAAEFGGSVAQIEPRFRDYLASSGKQYADYDAAFCNFVRNTPRFNGGNSNGKNHSTVAAADRLVERGFQLGPRPGSPEYFRQRTAN